MPCLLRYAVLVLIGLPFQRLAQGQTPPTLEPIIPRPAMFMDSWTKPETTVRRHQVVPQAVRRKVAPGPWIRLEAPDLGPIREEDAQKTDLSKGARRISVRRELPQPLVAGFGKGEVPWQTLPDGSSLWTASVESVSALGLRLHFTGVNLPPGAVLVIFNADNPNEVSPPYDLGRLGARNQFWTETVFASRVTIECVLPSGVAPAEARFTVANLMHRYTGLTFGGPEKAADPCNEDVTCHSDWSQTAVAVAGIGAIQDSGELFCTGCLLNDSAPADGTDYFLTANHCVGSQVEADDLEFYWFYQTSQCNGPVPNPGMVPRTSGGADLLAGSDDALRNDFTFLRLREPTPGGVTYAGWSTAALNDGDSVVSIHHPDGDYKRISFGNRLAAESQYHRVMWTLGVTEPGSSGSPLFDAQQRVIGQLYGGVSACDNPQGSDIYGRFDRTYPLIENWLLGQPVVVANDDFAAATDLAGIEGSVSGSSAGATRQAGEPFHAGNRGGHSVWYRWIAPEDSVMTFSTAGSGFDTVLAVYWGDSVDTLTRVAENDDGPEYPTSALSFLAAAGTTYLIAVDGYDGMGGEVVLNWLPGVGGGLASNDHFANALVLSGVRGEIAANNSGATREFSEPEHAGNPGGASLWFRWTAPNNGLVRFDTEGSAIDTVLAVYTGDSLDTLNSLAESDDIDPDRGIYTSRVAFTAQAGQVYFIAADGYGELGDFVEQGLIRLTWAPPTALTGTIPPNNAFAQAQVLTASSGMLTGSNLRASKESGEPDHAGNSGGRSVWYRWTAPAGGLVTFDTLGSDFDTILAIYSGPGLAALTERGVTDDIDRTTLQSRVTVAVSTGNTLQVAVEGYRTRSGTTREGTIQLSWVFEPGVGGNDRFMNAQVLNGAAGQAAGENRNATLESGEPRHAGNRGGRSVWYRWTAPESAEVMFETLGSTFDTVLAVYRGTTVNALTEVTSGDDIDFVQEIYTSRVTFQAERGVEYRLAVDGYRDDGAGVPPAESGDILLSWSQVKRPEVTLIDPRLTPEGFQVTVMGGAGDRVTLQVSAGWSAWDSLSSATLDVSGQIILTDPTATNRPSGYYRVQVE